MRLLFITQKLHGQDSFGVLWIREFIKQGFEVEALCLEGSNQSFEFPVHTLGKEKGVTRLQSALRFQKLISSVKYDRVFVHMAPIWVTLGWWKWTFSGIPFYLWYTHYEMQLGVRIFGWFGKRFFCATSQSLPQYEGSKKKVVVGHGIDLEFWPKRRNVSNHTHRLLIVHRLSRSKRLELSIRSLLHLDPSFTIDIYGIEAEPGYVGEMKSLVDELDLSHRVTFHGTVPMDRLTEIYTRHRLILNMASETIDKTMLEAMTCGCYPVTTKANAAAIGISEAPDTDTPEAIASFVEKHNETPPISADEMYEVVRRNHSLEGLVRKMGEYIRKGE